MSVDSRLRLKGFMDFLKKKKIPVPKENILCGEFQEKPAEEAMKHFWDPKKKITAMFCLNDTMAYGVMKAMGERGLRCPKDISLVGFDDDRRAASAKPPLTTLRVPLYEIARKAAERLVEFIEAKSRKGFSRKQELFPVSVVERDSVREA